MKGKMSSVFRITRSVSPGLLTGVLCIVLLAAAPAGAQTTATINVVDGATGDPIPVDVGFKWTLEEDTTYHVQRDDRGQVKRDTDGNPVLDPNWFQDYTLGLGFHASHFPVVGQGSGPSFTIPNSGKRYYISVLPDSGYSLGGAQIAPGETAVTVYVNPLPIPTAQISLFVFEDNFPTNNAPDTATLLVNGTEEIIEGGIDGFQIILEDAGGRYGASAGQAIMDAFGNPLGTTYLRGGDNNPILDADGAPQVVDLGTGVIFTENGGWAHIKNLAPAKYGLIVVPPAGQGWQQTTTIEGTIVIDAWVKANEPVFFAEFGPPGPHVFMGFVQVDPETMEFVDGTTLGTGSTISGQVANLHLSRPPETLFYPGAPVEHTTPWVALNDLDQGPNGKAVYIGETDGGAFAIDGVPEGSYQLVVFDDNLDFVIGLQNIAVTETGQCFPDPDGGTGSCHYPGVQVRQWFTRLEHDVFTDLDENGIWNDEPWLLEQNVNLRWRNGDINQAMATDGEGFVPFDEIFPFFSWQVAEVDYARGKPTGVTVTVDAGGEINPPANPADDWTRGGQLNPQLQPENNNQPFRTETGPVLTQAYQGFLGQTSVIQWGKKPWAPGENGGISGMVFYATTRAEDDPRWAAAEPWEPGIPRVQVTLYKDKNLDGKIDVLDADGGPIPGDTNFTLADVDYYPLDSVENPFPGPEDLDRNDNGIFDYGDAIAVTWTDSWDDNLPTGCVNPASDTFFDDLPDGHCFDGLRSFNQVRPGVFDGGYAFYDIGCGTNAGCNASTHEVNNPYTKETTNFLNPGGYIVEAATPPGYELLKEEDRNVDFGDEYVPSALLTPPVCVGADHLVPDEFALFQLLDDDGLNVAPYKAGQLTPLCDRKQVLLSGGANAAADFFLHTEAPISGHIIGFILDDLANEFDPNSVQFGEKYAPPFLPVSLHDWTGREISRVYSDIYGRYNMPVPSTYTANLPMPSGMSPNMLTACMNSMMAPDPDNPGQYVRDTLFNSQYSQFCYTFQYMPGTTTYLDTPVVPVAAFAGPGQFPVDCDPQEGTPGIWSVTNGATSTDGDGPWVSSDGGNLLITSLGQAEVPNPDYCPSSDQICSDLGIDDDNKTIFRNYGFGPDEGTVTLDGDPINVATGGWTDSQITATVPTGTGPGRYQLMVTNAAGVQSEIGVTVTIGEAGEAGPDAVVQPPGNPADTPIQDAIEAASPGDLITIAPGTYNEMVIMWKPVQLQGWGTGSVNINAINIPMEKIQLWRDKIDSLLFGNLVDPLPGQEIAGQQPGVAANTLGTEQAPGILVWGKKNNGANSFSKNVSRIDGLSIFGSTTGGGVLVNAYAGTEKKNKGNDTALQISNNRVENNSGFYSGGIRIGHPNAIDEQGNTLEYADAWNRNITVAHNQVFRNGAFDGAGGGISLYNGSDNYRVVGNAICGNFTKGHGAGIGHLGLSEGGVIEDNRIFLNENFNQAANVHGGGIYIGGAPNIEITAITEGAGNVTVARNLIQANMAGAGDGGGIALDAVNGTDIGNGNGNNDPWKIDLVNNTLANNVAGGAGGGISLQDSVNVRIAHNTVTRNDSTATTGALAGTGTSAPQPAGIVSYEHSDDLAELLQPGDPAFSNPELVNSIVYQNRSFHVEADTLVPPPGPFDWNDLGVLPGGTGSLTPVACLLTDPGATVAEASSVFETPVINTKRLTVMQQEQSLQLTVAPDEGGNSNRVVFGLAEDGATGYGRLSLNVDFDSLEAGIQPADFRLQVGDPTNNPAIDAADASDVTDDIEGDTRPVGAGPDIGSDESPYEPLNKAAQYGQTRSGGRRIGGGS